jgi:alginate O-acetyltransferase complex protein AlgI
MSYSIDVYRRRLAPVRSFLDLAFFISFFPQLVAGPIVRAMTFLPQVFEKRVWSNVDVRGAFNLFFIGFVKKACVSEAVAPIVDLYFGAPGRYNAYSCWIGVLFYAIQIYCDFSGYTDMAIATARLLGYELTLNFDFPYFSRNITEFWRKWHISLSTWLRDYLYISLGGNRGSKAFVYRNLMLTMVLGGLWHGASWTFVIWGALHGLALIVHREFARLTENAAAWFKKTMAVLAVPLTFYWVCVTWIYFRAQPLYEHDKEGHVIKLKMTGFAVAQTVLREFVLLKSSSKKESFSLWCLALFAGLAIVHWLCSQKLLATWWRRLPDWAYAACLGAGVALALFFMPAHYKPFIYFQF